MTTYVLLNAHRELVKDAAGAVIAEDFPAVPTRAEVPAAYAGCSWQPVNHDEDDSTVFPPNSPNVVRGKPYFEIERGTGRVIRKFPLVKA